MPGLLADVNVQGHLPYLVRLIKEIGCAGAPDRHWHHVRELS